MGQIMYEIRYRIRRMLSRVLPWWISP